MNTTVSARIPAELKAQVDAKLKAANSTASDLINAAYIYFLETGSIPCSTNKFSNTCALSKQLSQNESQALKEEWCGCSILQLDAYDGSNFKELLDEARCDYYFPQTLSD